MGFEYLTNAQAVIQTLKDYNTTTASPDLSSGLSTRLTITSIVLDDPNVRMVRNDFYPAIFVRISDGEEDFSSIGVTGPTKNRKEKTVVYDIFAMYKKEGANDSNANLMQDVYKLARNIEGVFQAEVRLSNTALWCNVKTTTFANLPVTEGSWVKTVLLELEAMYHFR